MKINMRNAYSDVFDNFIKYYLVVLFSAKEKHFSRISKNPIDFIVFYEIHLLCVQAYTLPTQLFYL